MVYAAAHFVAKSGRSLITCYYVVRFGQTTRRVEVSIVETRRLGDRVRHSHADLRHGRHLSDLRDLWGEDCHPFDARQGKHQHR